MRVTDVHTFVAMRIPAGAERRGVVAQMAFIALAVAEYPIPHVGVEPVGTNEQIEPPASTTVGVNPKS